MRLAPVLLPVVLSLLAASLPLQAAGLAPEIHRAPAPPQAVGVRHTLRGIPEACTRLEGMFTGDAARPYDFSAVRTSPTCQGRARFVDAGQAKPASSAGWILNDVIRVPSAACPGQQAVVTVWRHPSAAAPPKLDAQGRARIYLQESMDKARAGALTPIPMYAATLVLEGKPCE
ncbi:hypothetical protein [Cognatiluteimonas telluris]|jgi:hypothetical protein|uniref:hypothetical protein n=1 Tax=Cognatiluteimonas telluris TaxID=1104775 RepID=UPI00140E1E8C|nr:hypothetical protein [Lysobacter telluris]